VNSWPFPEMKPWLGNVADPSPNLQHHANRILVVEDEPTVARLIADVLEDEGFQVDVQLDGREALQQADRESYDLVICDMKMSELNGQHFYQALAQAGNSLSKRFLFVTGDVVAQHTQQFLEHHQLPHVAKPFRMEELKDCVHGLLSRDFSGEPKTREARNHG
jgi:two-component system alkaline phosphatase synthesis response regulator PhoP